MLPVGVGSDLASAWAGYLKAPAANKRPFSRRYSQDGSNDRAARRGRGRA